MLLFTRGGRGPAQRRGTSCGNSPAYRAVARPDKTIPDPLAPSPANGEGTGPVLLLFCGCARTPTCFRRIRGQAVAAVPGLVSRMEVTAWLGA